MRESGSCDLFKDLNFLCINKTFPLSSTFLFLSLGRNQTTKLANEVMICERYKTVYVLKRKTGCTTIRHLLERYGGCSSVDT